MNTWFDGKNIFLWTQLKLKEKKRGSLLPVDCTGKRKRSTTRTGILCL
jgi:hypothetical protein